MMRRIALALAAGLTLGFLIGEKPDRELRREAHRLAAVSGQLARSCESVVVENIRMARRPQERERALGP